MGPANHARALLRGERTLASAMARCVHIAVLMRRMVRTRPDGLPEIRPVSWRDVLGRGDLGLIGGLAAAWVLGTALQFTALVGPRVPIGALTLVLLRTIWVSGTAWLATTLLGHTGNVR